MTTSTISTETVRQALAALGYDHSKADWPRGYLGTPALHVTVAVVEQCGGSKRRTRDMYAVRTTLESYQRHAA